MADDPVGTQGRHDLPFAREAGWSHPGVVHSQATGDGRAGLRDPALYVFQLAIGDHRIVSCDDGKVPFTYRRVSSNHPGKMTLDSHEFPRRFLQRVLPPESDHDNRANSSHDNRWMPCYARGRDTVTSSLCSGSSFRSSADSRS
jgi:hypothetical protein